MIHRGGPGNGDYEISGASISQTSFDRIASGIRFASVRYRNIDALRPLCGSSIELENALAQRPAIAPKSSNFTLLASMAIIIAGLYLGREVFIPVALAILLSFLLAPAVGWLERLRFPRMLATLVVVCVGVGVVGGIGFAAGRQLVAIVTDLPQYQKQFSEKISRFSGHLGFFRRAEKGVESLTHAAGPTSQPATTRPAVGQAAPGAPGTTASDVAAPAGSSNNPSPKSPTTGSDGASSPTGPPTPENPLPVRVIPETTPLTMFRQYAGTLLSPLGTAAVVLVFVIFMIYSREDLRDRVIRLLGHGRLNVTTQALDEASTRISRYLGALSIVNGCYAVIVALGLWVFARWFGGGKEFPNVLVWGLLVGLLRFIPYVGIWIGAGIPLVLSFALFDGNGVFFATLAMFAVIETVVSQFVEPMWYGSSTGMSALAVLVAAVFWTWLWGVVGLLLSTPMTVILVVMGKYVPQLKFLDILLREEAVLSPHYRFYQRLIAEDSEEAADLAEQFLDEKRSLELTFDELLVPALSLAAGDSHRDRLEDERLRFVHQSVRDIVEDLSDQFRRMRDGKAAPSDGTLPKPTTTMFSAAKSGVASAASRMAEVASNVASAVSGRNGGVEPSASNNSHTQAGPVAALPSLPEGCSVNVLCLPARDDSDEIVALMLAQLLATRGYCSHTATADALASEMVEMVEGRKIDVVVVSAMPPGAITHARYLCKRLHTRYSDIAMLVGLWTFKSDLQRAKERIACAANVPIVTSLREAQLQIEEIAQPFMVREMATQAK